MKKLFFLPCLIITLIAMPAFAGYLPDTGQTKCYDNSAEIPCPQPGEPFYGQDAQYTCNPHSYTDLGNGIVRDNVTGLEWQQATAPGTYAGYGAEPYCRNLVLGGYSDWRLPTIKELSTLIDSSIYNPAINTTHFPDTVMDYYWSSTMGPDEFFCPACNIWYTVRFYNGVVHVGLNPNSNYVRAVRGGQLPNNKYIDYGHGIVGDTSTGLMWEQLTAPGTYTWEQALDYCENLTLADYSDWRLPSRNELQTIVDYPRSPNPINTTYFPDPIAHTYISSTTYAYNTDYTWVVYFGNFGNVGYDYKANHSNVRAVRSIQQCNQLGDFDEDTICDDGDNSTVLGDNSCEGGNIVNCDDNCLEDYNPPQEDFDQDGIGDVCDNCTDNDGDGYGNLGFSINKCDLDNCPDNYNPNQEDTDRDGIGDLCDNCPDDYNPLQGDIDNDTIGNICDNNPCFISFVINSQPIEVTDTDCDGLVEGEDNCPDNYNPNQEDTDRDGIGDLCDNCPDDYNPLQGDTDGDGIGNVCDTCTDSDNDGLGDPGFSGNTCPLDDCPYDSNNDSDNDAICGDIDNCPISPNSPSLGTCVKLVSGVFMSNGVVCSGLQDCGDGEYCQLAQEDHNTNGIGDACECYADCNNDGYVNVFDLILLKNEYNRNDCSVNPCDADCNDDGNVNVFDLIIMKNQYNRSGCPVVQ